MSDPDWRDVDARVRVEPGVPVRLSEHDPARNDVFADKDEAEAFTRKAAQAIDRLQDRLYAEGRRAVLVVLQGMDSSGKDGTIRAVFNATGPLGVHVTAFGRPSELERAHDYLWRVHQAIPRKGHIGIFNRSHYEDVLVAKVRRLAPADEIERRYAQINAFERHLAENGVTVLKFMLHISKDEQKTRLQERLDDPEKRWKWNAGDLEDRALWGEYQEAYEMMLMRCSTAHAPWRVVPADRKWRRNAVIAAIVHGSLTQMDPRYPAVDWRPEDFSIV